MSITSRYNQSKSRDVSSLLEFYINVCAPEFGADRNGKIDSAPAFRKAIKKAKDNGGGTIFIPAGQYLIDSSTDEASNCAIVVDEAITLMGEGVANNTKVGSWLIIKNTNIVPISVEAGGAKLDSFGIYYPEQQPKLNHDQVKFIDYKWSIQVQADDVRLTNLFLWNPYRGILFRRGKAEHGDTREHPHESTGRCFVDHIRGRPILTGIQIDYSMDTHHFDHIHFQRYWGGDSRDPNTPLYDRWFLMKEADINRNEELIPTAIRINRSDNILMSNLFCIGYFRGIHFGNNRHETSEKAREPCYKFHISNADIDGCKQALYISGYDESQRRGTTGSISNWSSQGVIDTNSNSHIYIHAPLSHIQFSNARIQTTSNRLIEVAGAGTELTFSSLYIGDWGHNEDNCPAIESGKDESSIFIEPVTFSSEPTKSTKLAYGAVHFERNFTPKYIPLPSFHSDIIKSRRLKFDSAKFENGYTSKVGLNFKKTNFFNNTFPSFSFFKNYSKVLPVTVIGSIAATGAIAYYNFKKPGGGSV